MNAAVMALAGMMGATPKAPQAAQSEVPTGNFAGLLKGQGILSPEPVAMPTQVNVTQDVDLQAVLTRLQSLGAQVETLQSDTQMAESAVLTVADLADADGGDEILQALQEIITDLRDVLQLVLPRVSQSAPATDVAIRPEAAVDLDVLLDFAEMPVSDLLVGLADVTQVLRQIAPLAEAPVANVSPPKAEATVTAWPKEIATPRAIQITQTTPQTVDAPDGVPLPVAAAEPEVFVPVPRVAEVAEAVKTAPVVVHSATQGVTGLKPTPGFSALTLVGDTDGISLPQLPADGFEDLSQTARKILDVLVQHTQPTEATAKPAGLEPVFTVNAAFAEIVTRDPG